MSPLGQGSSAGRLLAACSVALLLAVFTCAALAAQERYDYDALGRLIRVIDEQGRVTEYVYDAAGNLLQVITGGAAQAPAVTSISPNSIRRGHTRSIQISGTGLTGAHVSTSDPGLDITGLQTSATQITFSLTAMMSAALGTQLISISNAAGTASASITVNPVLPVLSMAPQPIALTPGSGPRTFSVLLSSADNVDHIVNVASANPAIATVSPSSLTFTAGQTEKTVTISGQAAGNTAINLTSTTLASTSVPVFVVSSGELAGLTTKFAPLLGVVVEQAPGGTATTFGPFASPLLGVAVGSFVQGVAPNTLAIGTGPTPLMISGAGLGGVTGVVITPSDGLTLGAISVAPDGSSVTVPVTVASNAPTTLRKVVLSGAQQPYIAARPGADQVLIMLPPPEIFSIDPIFATIGTTAMTLTIRGRNFQSAQSVALTPSTGISVSATPSVNADGTTLTVALSVAALAPTGPRVVTVTTPGGTSSPTPSAANTFSVVNEVQAVFTPIASPLLGVVLQDTAAAPAQTLSAFASLVGVVVPPAATGISPAVGIIGQTVNLTISGFGLNGLTAVQLSPPDGVTLGAPSVSPDGLTVVVSTTIALSAPQTLREVRLFAGAAQIVFTNPSAALFRVSAPLPEFDSISPVVLQVGAPAVTMTIVGRNFQNATLVRVDPPTGITVSSPTLNGAGTQATVTISAAAGSTTGPRAVILATPAGESPTAQSAANTLTLVTAVQGNVTPVTSPALGVVVQDNTPPPPQVVEPVSAPAVGVVLEDPNPPPPPQDTVRSLLVGVAVGPFASGVQAPPLTPTSSGTLVVSGAGLADVTAVEIEPSTGITVGTLTLAPDGTQVSAPITLAGAATGLRGVRVLRGTTQVPFIPAQADTFRIGVGVPSMDSITPILANRGQTITMIIRGQNFQDFTAVTATPATGLFIDSAPSVNTAGTEITVRIGIASDAPLGARVIRVITPGGATTDAAVPANTFTVQQ